ncbi:FIST signal transduction protein [Rheinheimera gaetbuli]
MLLTCLKTADYSAFCQALLDFQQLPVVGSVLVLLPEGNNWQKSDLDGALQRFGKPIIGGIFPQIINQHQCQTTGAILVGLPAALQIQILPLGEDQETTISETLQQYFPGQYTNNTLLVFTDGLAQGCAVLIEQLFNHFGLDINFIGGGAGSLSLQQSPCVITNQGLQQGIAIVGLMADAGGVGVAHGWQPITEAYRVTESKGNTIISLNWQSAFDVYQEVIKQHGQLIITEENFFDVAKAYPFGITKVNAELVVRDPIITLDKQLICVGDVPQGSFVHILTGDLASLPAAAAEAKNRALASLPHQSPIKWQLFIDCISRVLFLEQHFERELTSVSIDKVPMVGALTLGEIANNGQDYLEFYNKTAVVALFPEH